MTQMPHYSTVYSYLKYITTDKGRLKYMNKYTLNNYQCQVIFFNLLGSIGLVQHTLQLTKLKIVPKRIIQQVKCSLNKGSLQSIKIQIKNISSNLFPYPLTKELAWHISRQAQKRTKEIGQSVKWKVGSIIHLYILVKVKLK